ncbi:MAG: hypothetical protein NZ840_06215 [Anaerolineales bacterium]|nr:hypothetical protein [Anaerolineales bacterium]MDW8161633.1 hypothetical protein [Anaerolineales bacterium]
MAARNTLMALIFLQFIPVLLYPPRTLLSGIGVVIVALLFFAFLGYNLWRRRQWALTLSIFVQGLNIIVRLMMFFPAAKTPQGNWNIELTLFTAAAVILSGWILLRLDRPDIRSMMTA